MLAGRGVLRVVARFTGEQVDRRNRLTDGRLGVARMIGDGSDARDAHLGLIELAAAVCRPAEPSCVECPLEPDLPQLAGRRPARRRSCSEPAVSPARSRVQAQRLGDVGACCRSVATMRWKASYSPACIAAARSASPASSPAAGPPAQGRPTAACGRRRRRSGRVASRRDVFR